MYKVTHPINIINTLKATKGSLPDELQTQINSQTNFNVGNYFGGADLLRKSKRIDCPLLMQYLIIFVTNRKFWSLVSRGHYQVEWKSAWGKCNCLIEVIGRLKSEKQFNNWLHLRFPVLKFRELFIRCRWVKIVFGFSKVMRLTPTRSAFKKY